MFFPHGIFASALIRIRIIARVLLVSPAEHCLNGCWLLLFTFQIVNSHGLRRGSGRAASAATAADQLRRAADEAVLLPAGPAPLVILRITDASPARLRPGLQGGHCTHSYWLSGFRHSQYPIFWHFETPHSRTFSGSKLIGPLGIALQIITETDHLQ